MKKLTILLLLIAVTACTVNKTPEFKALTNVKVKNYSISTITVTSDLVFYNPNSLGGKLAIKDLKIYSNDVLISESNSLTFDTPAKADFTIPMTTEIRTSNLIKNRKDLMALAMNAAVSKTIPLHYKGTITYKLGALSYDYPIDYKTEVALRKE